MLLCTMTVYCFDGTVSGERERERDSETQIPQSILLSCSYNIGQKHSSWQRLIPLITATSKATYQSASNACDQNPSHTHTYTHDAHKHARTARRYTRQ